MEELLVRSAHGLELTVSIMAILVIAYGSLEAFSRLLRIIVTPGTTHGERKTVWRGFGMWLVLGLEFELAADIIGSVISPSWEDVGMLGAIAVIRTFLNYFLEKDLEASEEQEA